MEPGAARRMERGAWGVLVIGYQLLVIGYSKQIPALQYSNTPLLQYSALASQLCRMAFPKYSTIPLFHAPPRTPSLQLEAS
jgi:hypothetical protein